MSSAFPNEPGGMTPFIDWSCSNSLDPRIFNVYNSSSYISDGTAPLSPPSCFETYVGPNSNLANGQWVAYFPTGTREVFFATWWRANSTFRGYPNNTNKMQFLRSPSLSGDNSFLSWHGQPGTATPRTLMWYQQAPYNNTHVAGVFNTNYPVDGTGYFIPNINSAAATFVAGNAWTKIELYLKSSTTGTSRDGTIRIWVNGTLSSDFTNVNLMPGGIEEWNFTHAWDGGDRGDTAKWAHYWDHFYCSTRTSGGVIVPVLSALTPASVTLTPGNTQTFTVSMNTAVTSSSTISVSSSNPAVATVPASVTVSSGQTSTTFTATAVGVGTSTLSTVYGSSSRTANVTVTSSGGGGGGTTTTYAHSAQFSSTQDSNGWSYRDTSGSLLTYSSGSGLWNNPAHVYLGIWGTGCHPGYSVGSVLRWTAPRNGSARITGSVADVDLSAGDGVLFEIKYGSATTLYSKDLSGSDATTYAYDVTQTMSAGDFIDFIVTAKTNGAYDSTSLNPSIAFSEGSTNPLAPVISSFTPTSGTRGVSVTVVGANFSGTIANNIVTVNGVLATVTSASPTQLIFTVPQAATTGAVQITTSTGSATGSTFTVTDPVTPDIPPASNFGGNAFLLLVMP